MRLLEESKDITYAYLFNNRLTSTGFLQYMLLDFGLPAAGKNKCEMLFDLSQFLVSRASRQMTTVLIVDEAHLLSEELLEEVRLLSNLETYDDKLLQILLVGQPELDEKLDSRGLRQLKQRIALAYPSVATHPGRDATLHREPAGNRRRRDQCKFAVYGEGGRNGLSASRVDFPG